MRLRSSLVGLLLAAAPFGLQAANPSIRVDRDPPNPTVVLSDSFTFGANPQGGGDLSFQNGSGTNWRQLDVLVTLNELVTIDCGAGPFETCAVATTPQGGSFLYDILFGPAPRGGIPNGSLFSINLNDNGTDPNGTGSWPSGQDFAVTAKDVAPEPSAGALALAGCLALAGVGFYRRRLAA